MKKHVLLAVFAHPDDETIVGPLLARCAAEGQDVYIVCITSGQKGFRPHCGIPPGEELGKRREAELRASAQALGVHPPYLLGFEDQGFASSAVAGQVAERLREIIGETRADVLLTLGPDGITGHIDHRMASNIATAVFADQKLLPWKPSKLYYLEFPEAPFAANRNPLHRKASYTLVSDEFITTEIDCSGYLEAGLRAIRCHRTQWRPERMEQLYGILANLLGGKLYLRLALTRVPRRTDGRCEQSLFEGL